MNIKFPLIKESVLRSPDFWWLIGFVQGDGFVDTVDKEEIRLTSVNRELILHAAGLLSSLFGLEARVRVEWHKPPIKPQFRLAVYSKILVDWILHLGLKFGMRKWNVPSLPESLFLPYLAGLFDAEGSLIMSRNRRNQKKIRQIIIYSTNRRALAVISRTLSRLRIKTSILERKRRPHYDYELRMSKGVEKKWFVEEVGGFVHHPRKRRYLNSIYLP